jgi:glycosyltransferase involved in cell wall biosynthesis
MVILAKRGHEVTLLASRFGEAPKNESLDGVRIIRLGGLFSIFLLAPFKVLMMSRKFDVLVDTAIFGIPFFSRIYSRKPTITVCHHLPRETFQIEANYRGPLGWILSSLAMIFEDKLYPLFYRDTPLLTFSESTKRDLVGIGFREHNVIVAPHALAHVMFANSFDTDTITKRLQSYQEPVEKNGVPTFVCLGRLKKYKGVQDAVFAMGEVIKKVPDAKLLILGRGDYAKDLEELVLKLSLARNVRFFGYVSFETKIQLIKQAHALIMPSYKEGFPTPIFEAQACRTPVVANDARGVSEYVTPGVDGVVYEKGDWKEMASLLLEVSGWNGSHEVPAKTADMWLNIDWERRESELVRLMESLSH